MNSKAESFDDKAERVALETAHRLLTYGSYQGTEQGALNAMRRRLSGSLRAENRQRLQQALALAHRCRALTEMHLAELEKLDRAKDPALLHRFDDVFAAEFPHYAPGICRHLLHLCIDWDIRG